MSLTTVQLWQIRDAVVGGRFLLEDVLNRRTPKQQAIIDALVEIDDIVTRDLSKRANARLRRELRWKAGVGGKTDAASR